MDAQLISQILGCDDRTVWLITSAAGTSRGGLIATGVMNASIVPHMPRIVAAIGRLHETHQLIAQSKRFVMHLLRPDQLDFVWTFGLHSSRDIDKFDGRDAVASTLGAPILTAAPAWLECSVEAGFEIGDRTLFLAEVVNAGGNPANLSPLTLQGLISSAPPDRIQELKRQMAEDAGLDETAIRNWRQLREKGGLYVD